MSRHLRSLLTSSLPALLLAAAPAAQTGPWTDGEILMRSQLMPSGENAIFRVVPETGATAVLTTVHTWGGYAGSMAFDSYRGGLLTNTTKAPGDTFVYRLWLVSHDGTSVALPGFTGGVRALAPAGDGRIFFVRYTGASQGPTTVEYFDATNKIHKLMQSDGVTPFQADVEHMLYDAPSNALIGSSTAQWSATHCSPVGNSLYRFPLSADGLRVEGPVTCVSVPTSLIYGDLVGLDHLPDGKVLVATASAFLGAPHGLLSVNPVTLAVGTWATPQQYDVNGGIWSARLGKAVVAATSGSAWWEPDGLRSFVPGQSGFGSLITTSLPLPMGGGFSPVEIMTEVDLNGPACDGFALAYGAGLAGNGGFVPSLGIIGCPDIGSVFTLAIASVNGGAIGLLAFSPSGGAVPFVGGELLIGPPVLIQPCIAGGTPGKAGDGGQPQPCVVNDPTLIGLHIYLQAGFLDAAAVQGISLTNGLRLVIG